MKSTPDTRILESYGHLRRALNLHYTQSLRPLGIGAKQAALMRLLAKQGKASLAELSRATLTDPASTTRSVNILSKKGWVKRKDHPTDNRRWELALTPQGEKMAVKVLKTYSQLSHEVAEALSPVERDAFIKTLDKLNDVFSTACLKTSAEVGE
jgi:DNA-binding MarR family transcriptional regulator